MPLNNTTPTIWSAKIWEKLPEQYVYGDAFTNRDYEGELQGPGDTVKITGVGTIAVAPFTGTLDPPEVVDDVDHGVLQATEQDAFNFGIPIKESKESILNVYDEYSAEAAISLAASVDAYVSSFHSSVTGASNTYGDSTTPIVVGFGTGEIRPYDVFLELNQLLDDLSVPKADRRTVLPPWFIRAIKRELGIRQTQTGDQVIVNGKVTRIDNVDIRESTLVPNVAGAKYKLLLGLNRITYADTIKEVQVYKPEANFDTAVKGLHVYGAKLTHPQTLSLATVNKGDLTAPV